MFFGVLHYATSVPRHRAGRELTGDRLILDTHTAMIDDPEPAMRFYPGTELNDDPTNW